VYVDVAAPEIAVQLEASAGRRRPRSAPTGSRR
jgi:hypothetical protein